MIVIKVLTLLVAVLLVSSYMTWAIRRYALARNILDIPNQRSSHTVPTPRGGGVAIVLSCNLALLAMVAFGWLQSNQLWIFVIGGSFVALIGFLDDHHPVAPHWRLLVHFLAASWGLFWLGGVPELDVWGPRLVPEWCLALLGVLYLVWLLNLYNFMDGIDGIAGVEAVCVCLSGALFYGLVGQWQIALLPGVVAVACLGFLFWNFPPARIFMGDSGSGYLGLMLGLLSLQAAWVDPSLFWAWLIMLGVFVVDSSVTLLRRVLRGERIYQAHRSHAYQFASRHYGRHLPVTMAIAVINLFWLLPFALWVVHGGNGVLLLLLSYTPLILIALKFRAGTANCASAWP